MCRLAKWALPLGYILHFMPKKREAGLQAVPERAGGFLEAAVHARAGRRRAVGDDRVERHLQPAA